MTRVLDVVVKLGVLAVLLGIIDRAASPFTPNLGTPKTGLALSYPPAEL